MYTGVHLQATEAEVMVSERVQSPSQDQRGPFTSATIYGISERRMGCPQGQISK